MRLLILGGTWFVGRVLAEDAVGRGWAVTTFNRGRSGPDVAGVHPLRGDRTDVQDLERLAAAGPWDAVVDVGGAEPRSVGLAAQVLGAQAGRYVFVSTVSVYRDWPASPVDESSPLHPGNPDLVVEDPRWDAVRYGPHKAGCEAAVRRSVSPDRLLMVRPGVVLGPYEYVGRLPWWLRRMARGGRVLAPAPADRPIQPVDVRDLASFLLDLIGRSASGIFNVAAPTGHATYGRMLDACAAATRDVRGADEIEVVWAEPDWLVEQGVRQWTEIPLWRVQPGTWRLDATRAAAAGLRCRPIEKTVLDTWAWLAAGGAPVRHERQDEHGFDPDRERRLVDLWELRSQAASGEKGLV
ncbi:NAD-dependent epimerase/dehydratase family protein [Frankia sp. BMG5.23]|uniref:NAD-dependent epimerase/dehydratase family protein n=1 Tax=Frankia sp. BMG5.23 TaxID=683305 RepID=UPI0004616C3B|nr:NAD-dependent epimerase/dehydratase family protein [Frankia sp. BMG5.23]KDA41274.1 nucleoside-diphosphate-sugar epimerase [Frankia sp. BMG5.23]